MGPTPDLWSVLQKWIISLPADTEENKTRQSTLAAEAKRLMAELGSTNVRGMPNVRHIYLLWNAMLTIHSLSTLTATS